MHFDFKLDATARRLLLSGTAKFVHDDGYYICGDLDARRIVLRPTNVPAMHGAGVGDDWVESLPKMNLPADADRLRVTIKRDDLVIEAFGPPRRNDVGKPGRKSLRQ